MSLKNLKQRITSVKQTQKITRAMKMVAASKLKKSQVLCESSRPFFNEIKSIITKTLSQDYDIEEVPEILKGNHKSKGHLLIVISADRGLCGSFNGSVLRTTKKKILEINKNNEIPFFIFLGKKANDSIGKNYLKNTIHTDSGFSDCIKSFTKMEEKLLKVSNIINNSFKDGRFGKISIVDTHFKSIISQECQVKAVTPFEFKKFELNNSDLYRFDGGQQNFLEKISSDYIFNVLYESILESTASEQGARMSAMDSATRNASDMIKSLELSYNRLRQSAITNELIEIISGAQALEK